MNELLLKYLQKTKGISRRDFLDIIKEKAIKINGIHVNDIKIEIKDGDKMTIKLENGKEYEEIIQIKNEKFKPIIVVFNKPKGYVVSKEDKHNKTIFELLPNSWQKDFYYIGRLDKNSHGLLLLTNSSDIVDEMEHPKNRILKIYEVVTDKLIKTKDIIKMKKGAYIDEVGNLVSENNNDEFKEFLQFFDIKQVKDSKGKYFLRIILLEGKKRHIRRMLNAYGYKTIDLKRIKFGKYELGDIKEGKYRIYKL